MPRSEESMVDLLLAAPWWISVILAAIAYLGLAVILPSSCSDGQCFIVLQVLAETAPNFAPFVSIFLLFLGGVSAFKDWQKRRLLDEQTSLESIRNLTWEQFEELIAEYYRRRGYNVTENERKFADGGVDVRLNKDGSTILVQCKQWRAKSVGVKTIRELYGVVTAEHASEGVVVSSGSFTKDAIEFADGLPLVLINGNSLSQMIRSVQNTNVSRSYESTTKPDGVSLTCPKCRSKLVKKVAKRGPKAGSEFWGCSGFPKCRYTQDLAS